MGELRVKGLTQGNNSTSDNKPKSEQKPAPSRPVPAELPPAPAPKRPRPAPVQSSSYQSPAVDDDDIQEVVPVKSEPGGGIAADNSGYVGDQGAGAVALDDTYADENYDYGADGNKVDELLLQYLVESWDFEGKKQWTCSQCQYCRKDRSQVSRHIEQKHLNLSIACELC